MPPVGADAACGPRPPAVVGWSARRPRQRGPYEARLSIAAALESRHRPGPRPGCSRTPARVDGATLGAPAISSALTPEQAELLKQRGYLHPEEIHALASKTRSAIEAKPGGKAACHSDYVDADEAKQLQQEQLVQLNTAPAHNIASEDRVV